ncbi:MAG: response regulator transcription factor [Lachnospiraceae bacterium]|nr:response regulator transcription factor [Lachnospiraceae bacterium]MBP5254632.1 response regulator transcription factor [Lachnospiraceae bacterium]
MYKIAIVDDEYESLERLRNCLERYGQEKNLSFSAVCFRSGVDFIESYKNDYDMVFMDIDMPQMNGFDTAEELRKKDSTVVLVFVTFLMKYALRGYKLDALDYLIKPLNYNAFMITMDRAVQRCSRQVKAEVTLPASEGSIRIELNCLNYVEISNHDITYHTSRGEYSAYGTMRTVEKLLPEKQFCKCNRSILVNLRNVTRIQGNDVYVGTERLEISRSRKQEFLAALHTYNVY